MQLYKIIEDTEKVTLHIVDQFYKVLNFEVTLNDSTAHLRDAWFGGQGVKHY